MLLAGDEMLQTQGGNNNAYCQDNEVAWFDWALADRHAEMLRFTRELIALRRRHPCLTLNRFYTGAPVPGRDLPDIAWHAVRLDEPPWHDGEARLLRFTIAGLSKDEDDLHVVLNMAETGADVALPRIGGRRWHVAVDTSRPAPLDVVERHRQDPWEASSYSAGPRSAVVLEARG
jgi:glycogen operon protein